MTSLNTAVAWLIGGALLLGCSGADKNSDLFSAQQQQNTEPDPVCLPGVRAECPASETAYATQGECSVGHDTCYRAKGPLGCLPSGRAVYCGVPKAQCTGVPVCEPDDEQVSTCPKGATCYSKIACDVTILCQRPFANCDAYPSCDPGDVKAIDETTCKKAGACYSRTLCGSTIWCVDKI